MSLKVEFDYLREGDSIKVKYPSNKLIRTGEILKVAKDITEVTWYHIKYTDHHIKHGFIEYENVPAEWVCFYLGRHTDTGENSMATSINSRETLEKMTKNEVIETCLVKQEQLSKSFGTIAELNKQAQSTKNDVSELKVAYERSQQSLINKNGVIMEMQATIDKQADTIHSLTAELEIANKDLTDLQRRYDVTRDITEEKQSLNYILTQKISSLSAMLTAISEVAINAKKII